MIIVNNITKNASFRAAVAIAVEFTNWDRLQAAYNDSKDPEERKYLLFFLEHLYRREIIESTGVGGRA